MWCAQVEGMSRYGNPGIRQQQQADRSSEVNVTWRRLSACCWCPMPGDRTWLGAAADALLLPLHLLLPPSPCISTCCCCPGVQEPPPPPLPTKTHTWAPAPLLLRVQLYTSSCRPPPPTHPPVRARRTSSQVGNCCFREAKARAEVMSVVFWLRMVRTKESRTLVWPPQPSAGGLLRTGVPWASHRAAHTALNSSGVALGCAGKASL